MSAPLDPTWYLSAACSRSTATEWDDEGTEAALALCLGCPVRAACLADALGWEANRVADERGALRGAWTPTMRARAVSGPWCSAPGCEAPTAGGVRATYCRVHVVDGTGARLTAARKAARDRARNARLPRDEVRVAARERAERRAAREYAAASAGDDLFGALLFGDLDDVGSLAS